MAISNVRSSEYRAAGGRAWNRVKSSGGVRMNKQDKHMTGREICNRQDRQDKEDAYLVVKEQVKEQLLGGYDESKVTVIPEGKRGARRKKK